MNKIPIKIKYLIYGLCLLIFILLYSGFGVRLMIGISNSLLDLTGYFFAFSSTRFDYLILSCIPLFGLLFNSTRTKFEKTELIKDILTVLFCVIIMFGIGLYILTFIGKHENPLIPEYLLSEPFELYTTIIIGIGIAIPFLFIKRTEKPTEIDNIEINN